MIEIAELPLAPGGDHVALVDAKAERRPQQQPQRKSPGNQQDQRARSDFAQTAAGRNRRAIPKPGVR